MRRVQRGLLTPLRCYIQLCCRSAPHGATVIAIAAAGPGRFMKKDVKFGNPALHRCWRATTGWRARLRSSTSLAGENSKQKLAARTHRSPPLRRPVPTSAATALGRALPPLTAFSTYCYPFCGCAPRRFGQVQGPGSDYRNTCDYIQLSATDTGFDMGFTASQIGPGSTMARMSLRLLPAHL